jgi:hypothetical protein
MDLQEGAPGVDVSWEELLPGRPWQRGDGAEHGEESAGDQLGACAAGEVGVDDEAEHQTPRQRVASTAVRAASLAGRRRGARRRGR